MNWYTYTGGNPVVAIDPSGEIAPIVAAIALYALFNAPDIAAVGYDGYAAARDPSTANVGALVADAYLAPSPAPAVAGVGMRAGQGLQDCRGRQRHAPGINPFKAEIHHLLPKAFKKQFARASGLRTWTPSRSRSRPASIA